jgi:hypothetical protein
MYYIGHDQSSFNDQFQNIPSISTNNDSSITEEEEEKYPYSGQSQFSQLPNSSDIIQMSTEQKAPAAESNSQDLEAKINNLRSVVAQ